MTIKQFIPIPFIVAALAFTIVIVDQLIAPHMPIADNKGFGWVAFITWSLYFAVGGTAPEGRKVWYAYLYGVAAAIAIVAGATALSTFTPFLAAPIAIFFGVLISLFFERVPFLDNIPAIFIAAATFFAIMTYVPGATYTGAAITELVYAALGLIYGWIAVFCRGKYEAAIGFNSDA